MTDNQPTQSKTEPNKTGDSPVTMDTPVKNDVFWTHVDGWTGLLRAAYEATNKATRCLYHNQHETIHSLLEDLAPTLGSASAILHLLEKDHPTLTSLLDALAHELTKLQGFVGSAVTPQGFQSASWTSDGKTIQTIILRLKTLKGALDTLISKV